MTKSACRLALMVVVTLAAGSTPALAQLSYSGPGSTTGSLLRNIQLGSSGGGAFSIDATNSQILNQSRAFAASNGINAYPTANSSISRSGPRLPTMPGVGGSGAKPFANISPDSTVSPYLSLFNETSSGAATTIDNYNVLVRPQLQQQSTNRQLQRQAQQLNARVQSISAQSAFETTGSERMMATGHQTTFGYYSRFYPALNRRR